MKKYYIGVAIGIGLLAVTIVIAFQKEKKRNKNVNRNDNNKFIVNGDKGREKEEKVRIGLEKFIFTRIDENDNKSMIESIKGEKEDKDAGNDDDKNIEEEETKKEKVEEEMEGSKRSEIDKKYMAYLKGIIEKKERDNEAEQKYIKEVLRLMDEKEIEKEKMRAVNCVKEICKIELDVMDVEDTGKVIGSVFEIIPLNNGRLVFLSGKEPEEIVIIFARPGEEIPDHNDYGITREQLLL